MTSPRFRAGCWLPWPSLLLGIQINAQGEGARTGALSSHIVSVESRLLQVWSHSCLNGHAPAPSRARLTKYPPLLQLFIDDKSISYATPRRRHQALVSSGVYPTGSTCGRASCGHVISSTPDAGSTNRGYTIRQAQAICGSAQLNC
ncbi:hypothetical protein DFP73DRAFT_586405 [Morchella snyderi]|nr:hypothetical protein DFP73DRAFT_586405 [Morchella snyderi]